ncbi:ABC transporter substrate-binding protein [Phytoactinopolyspora alkaliphila]|uniref:ABC transporter substrate-binding protein n=1 Tax=Phytoactinopolyspora alkaliphila TaxID=1783498 RepID=A0A6N9YGL1_9ACTN|nr:glycine betaine ABC transporter substrate-binding protein [Phytoactinopolyspora alkaliphila]NED94048.1 ABC transporter substrate-binding protein [Phytoactinopolyspora alkaliphila]
MPVRSHLVASAAGVALMTVAACGGDDQDGAGDGSTGSGPGGGEEIVLLQQPWEDLVVENQILSQLLADLGYEARIADLAVPVGAVGLADGDVDVYLGNWWPSQEPVFAEHLEAGEIDVVTTLVTGTTYAPVVPAYVSEEHGITSLADLAPNADLFGKQFVGIESGTPGNEYIADAIAADAYGLGDWELIESSTAAMLADVGGKAEQGEPVVFLGWEPHWMNVEWDLVYLDDPEGVWPGAGEIRVVTRSGFADDHPEVTRLLSQMEIDLDTASEWIYLYGQEEVPAETIASEWIADNQDTVQSWLEGVETESS